MNLASFSNSCSSSKLETVCSKCIRFALKPNGYDAPLNVSNLVYLGFSGMFSFDNMLRFRRLSDFTRVLEHSPIGLRVMLACESSTDPSSSWLSSVIEDFLWL